MTKSKQVATKAGGAVANLDDFEKVAAGIGTGMENVGVDDLLIPRLTIIQSNSPQILKSKPEYDESAKQGMIWDVGLQEGFEGPLVFLPVHYVKQWLQWAPRNSGKGLQAIHDTPDILEKTHRDEKNKPVLDNGDYIAETAQFYGLNLSADGRRTFLPMTSTQLKKARRINTLASSEKIERKDGSTFTPPLYYRQYVLSTVPESNAEGDWFGWKVERGDPLTALPNWEGIMEDIRSFREALTTGAIKGDLREDDHAAAPADPDGAM
jgi:hypothetical protein